MKIYKVGGCVRDKILGLEPTDNDWVVVGATPAEMLYKGFKKVGNDFPVFLHPETHEEYALARTERSTGSGHTDFSFNFSPNVTLEMDLKRRDLTINAIAADKNGNLIDPCGGIDDLLNDNGVVIRHVSDAFSEDPLRVLRAARFYAKFKDSSVAPETYELCRSLFSNIFDLSGERIWGEIEKTLNTADPIRYFDLLWDWSYTSKYYSRVIYTNFKLPILSGTTYWFPKDAFIDGVWVRDDSEEGDVYDFTGEINPGFSTPESWWCVMGILARERKWLDSLHSSLKVPNSYRRMCEQVYDFRNNYFFQDKAMSFSERVSCLYESLENINSNRNSLEQAINITYLASHRYVIEHQDNLKNVPDTPGRENFPSFLREYRKIDLTREEKNLDDSQKKMQILKDKKISFIKQEL